MWRLVLSALSLAIYAWLAHRLMVNAPESPWALGWLLGPPLVMAAGLAAARRRWWTLALSGSALAALGWLMAKGGLGDVQRLYVLQHALINGAIGTVFAATLRAGRVPMITSVALKVHGGRMQAAKYPYTRRVTEAWVAYFFGVVLLSLLLYGFADWAVWSAFANFVTPLLAGALLVGEWRLRYWLHPEFERVPISVAIRAFREPGGAVSQR